MSETAEARRRAVSAARRVVLKVGTRVITHDGGRLALSRLFGLVEVAAGVHGEGKDVLLVSSGAVGLGRDALGLAETPGELSERQACAAIGQGRLMALYEQGFSRLGIVCGQVLLTQGDFHDRVRYLNLRTTLGTLLQRRVVPIINENDVVSTEEIAVAEGEPRLIFGDNDRLSALVAAKLDAELLVLLTDVPGLYAEDPRKNPDAALVRRVDDIEAALAAAGAPGSAASRGGMRSKVESAAIAARSGCHVIIASGREPGVAARVLAGDEVGTWFPAGDSLPARDRWLSFATAPRGTLHLDAGAVAALRLRGASLLAAGVQRVEGEFQRGDVVELRGPDGARLGRGMVQCDASAARRWCDGERPDGARNHHALVHRDNLVLEP